MLKITPNIATALSPKQLRLIIFPTEQCNFRCTYCYEDFKHGKMAPDVVAAIKKLISVRVRDISALEIGWFGGEPLLAADVVLEISEFANSQTNDGGAAYLSSMTTNGYRLRLELARHLMRAGVRHYQISLDGDQPLHDRSRIMANGRGTFDIIWGNLLKLRELDEDFSIVLRVHYRKESWLELRALVERIARSFVGDSRFKVFFKSVVRLGGANDSQISRISVADDKFIKATLISWIGGNLEVFDPAGKDSGGYVCYAAAANSFVIRSDGSLNKCTVALNYDPNKVGWLRSDGSLQFEGHKLKSWMTGLVTGNESALACPYGQMKATRPQ